MYVNGSLALDPAVGPAVNSHPLKRKQRNLSGKKYTETKYEASVGNPRQSRFNVWLIAFWSVVSQWVSESGAPEQIWKW